MKHDPDAAILSCVGGGPMERVAQARTELSAPTHVVARFSAHDWRTAMGTGRLARIRGRLASWLGYPLSSVKDVGTSRPDAVAIPTTNPPVLPLVMTFTRFIHGRRVAVLVYDLYPDALEASGLSSGKGLGPALMRAINRYWFRRADGVVFIGHKMAEHCRATYGEPRAWTVIETGADIREFSAARIDSGEPESDLERWCAGRTVVTYVGNLGHVHEWATLAEGLGAVLRAPASKERPLGVVIAAFGPGADYLRRELADVPRDRLRFEPPLEDRAWARLLARSDISLVSLKTQAYRTSIPSKMFSAMAAGNAVLAVAPRDSDLADIVTDTGCGAVTEPGDAQGFASTLRSWLEAPETTRELGERARSAVHERFDMPVLAHKWSQFLRELPAPVGERYELQKRAMDIACATLGLVAGAPFLLGAAIAIRATMGPGVLYRQERPGLGGKPFHLIKFRSMAHARADQDSPDHDAARLTRLGRFLRATSLDELPTLLNVLRGDMSLVGPRPLLMRYLPRYSPQQARRHDVKPGVTGWAQIHGRNAISWNEKFAYDVWYVDHRQLWLDLYIIARTIGKVLARDGTSSATHATMEEFMGNQETHADG